MVTSENLHLHPPFLESSILNLVPQHCGKVLDVGCGLGDLGYLLKTRKKVSYLVGLDIYHPYLRIIKRTNIYNEVVQARLPNIPLKQSCCFDFIFVLELIEHLPKQSGYGLLDQLERMGRNIIVSTPQRVKINKHESNPFLNHISEWSAKELEQRGYTVITIYKFTRLHRITETIRTFLFKRQLPSIHRIAYMQF